MVSFCLLLGLWNKVVEKQQVRDCRRACRSLNFLGCCSLRSFVVNPIGSQNVHFGCQKYLLTLCICCEPSLNLNPKQSKMNKLAYCSYIIFVTFASCSFFQTLLIVLWARLCNTELCII